jgi:hypothetical protein
MIIYIKKEILAGDVSSMVSVELLEVEGDPSLNVDIIIKLIKAISENRNDPSVC